MLVVFLKVPFLHLGKQNNWKNVYLYIRTSRSSSTDLLTLRVLDVLGQQEDEVCDHGPGEDQLQREDGLHLADEAPPDRLVPEVETGVGLTNH